MKAPSICLFAILLAAATAPAAELWIGTASTSITPDRPVALAGQMHTRIAKNVESPCTATALALESRQGDKSLDHAIFVACDLAVIRGELESSGTELEKYLETKMQKEFRQRVKPRLKGFDVEKLFLTATHTHSGPVTMEGVYTIPPDVMQPREYLEFLFERLEEIVIKAWVNRQPGGVSWGLGHAVVAQNRRAVYADGTAQMYGKTDRADFRGFEGYEDHGVEILFFWDARTNLTATAINVACPAQEVESAKGVNADYWHEVREMLRGRHGSGLQVLGWIGAAGDQSPHLMYRKAAEERMRQLRGLTRLEEIARRIVQAFTDVFEVAKKEIHFDVPLIHKVQTVDLPIRKVTEEEAAKAKAECAKLLEEEKKGKDTRTRRLWHEKLLQRYEWQQSNPVYRMELHVIRLGDVAICTNPFELFTDYGIQIKGRSKALQTFVIQLAAGPGTYLPTERAVRGGGYSAVPQSNLVGPEGGQVLVDRTVEAINALFNTTAQ